MTQPKYECYIESEDGNLFRGIAPGLPKERWSPNDRKFIPYTGGAKPEGWGRQISAEQVLEMMEV